MTTSTKRPDGGEPFVSGCCGGEKCHCGVDAAHKVEETIFYDDPIQTRHPLTTYLCHPHFVEMMGPAARYPGETTNESPAPQAWRDINTAPRDGTEFLAWQDAERGPFKCWWHTGWPRAEAYWMDPQDSEPEPKFWQPMLPVPLER